MSAAILEGFLQHLEGLGLSPPLPVYYPSVTEGAPPANGMWLEATWFPNQPQDPFWNDDGCVLALGYFQILVGYRVGAGQLPAAHVADAICTFFAKGTILGPVPVSAPPFQAPQVVDKDKIFIPVRIPYRGFVNPASGGYSVYFPNTFMVPN